MNNKYFNYNNIIKLLNNIVNFLYSLVYKKEIVKEHYEVVDKYTINALKVCDESNYISDGTCILKSNLPNEFQDIATDGNPYVKYFNDKEVLYEKFIRKPYIKSLRSTQFERVYFNDNLMYVCNINHNLGTEYINVSIKDEEGFLLLPNVQIVNKNNIKIYLLKPKNIDISIIGWKGDVY